MQKTVVLIDDDPDDLFVMKETVSILEPSFKCFDFSYPEEAIHTLSQDHISVPNYIFIDINMPLKTGPECLMELRNIKAFDETIIIMYSTHLPKDISTKLIQSGANFAFQKPVSMSAYLSVLKDILELK